MLPVLLILWKKNLSYDESHKKRTNDLFEHKFVVKKSARLKAKIISMYFRFNEQT